MKLSNKKYYDISAAIDAIAPGIRAKAVYDNDGVATLTAEAGEIPRESAIDAEGIKVLKVAKIAEVKAANAA